MRKTCFGLLVLKGLLTVAAGAETDPFLPAVPEGYQSATQCSLARVVLNNGDRLTGKFALRLADNL
jgi:hypothetical protein